MQIPGQYTLSEIFSQPDAWRETIIHIQANRGLFEQALAEGFDEVIFTGCGSTYYTALASAAFLRALTGKPARALPGSELWLNPHMHYDRSRRVLLVPISRSGETSETIQACRDFHTAGRGSILTLSCYPGSTLANLGDWNLVLTAGQEESYAQTRAFTCLYIAALSLGCLAGDHDDLLAQSTRLPESCASLLQRCGDKISQIGQDLSLDRVYFLGSGLLHGLACELSMKMKEMSLTHCEPFHFLEFRHGPKTMASRGSLVVGLVSSDNSAREQAVANEVAALGARVLLIGEAESGIAFQCGLPFALTGPLYLPAGQLLAYHHAIAKGLDPDRPFNLQPVIKL